MSISAAARIQRRRTFPATRQPDGLWTISNVPVLLDHKVPLLGADGQPITRNGRRLVFRFTKDWLEQAKVNMDRHFANDGYEALVHVNHHNRGRPVEDAGFWRPEGVRRFSYRGRRCWALFAQLYDVPDEVYQDLARRRLKYVSAEVNSLIRAPEVDSLALLRDTTPFFRIAPIVPSETPGYGDVRDVQSGAVVQASDSRRFQVAMFMGMATDEAMAKCGEGVCKCHGACGGKSPGGQMSGTGGGKGKLREIVSRVGESHKAFMAALDDLQQVIDGDGGGEQEGIEDPGSGAVEQEGDPDKAGSDDEAGDATDDEEEEGLSQARQFVDEDDENDAGQVRASDNSEGHREDDDDAEGDYKSQMQAEIEKRDAQIARLQGELRGKAAVGNAQARREAAILEAVEKLRPLGVTRSEIEPYAAKGQVVLQAFVDGSLGSGSPMLSDWGGEVPLDMVADATTTPELAFISGLPREKQGVARQYAAEHAAMRISGMPLREHVIDSMIYEGHLSETEFGHMRQGA